MKSVAGAGALAKLAARRDRLMLPAWLYLLTATLASTGYSFKSLYKTPASREAVYHSTVHNATLLGLAGPLYGDSVGALTTWKIGSTAAVLAALMSIFARDPAHPGRRGGRAPGADRVDRGRQARRAGRRPDPRRRRPTSCSRC